NHLDLPIFESAPEVRALCSAGITQPQRSYDPVRLPPEPPPIATLRPLPSLTLTPDEVYALTAYLLFVNKVIPEDLVLDKRSLRKGKVAIGDASAKLHEWKPRTLRLEGYPC